MLIENQKQEPPAAPPVNPITTTKTSKHNVFNINFDSIKDTGTPTLVASGLLPFRNNNNNKNAGSIITIKTVSSNMEYPFTWKYKYKAVGHSKCTDRVFSGHLPKAFFCIDQNTGDLYTTNLVRNMRPGEEFTVTININSEPVVTDKNNVEDTNIQPPTLSGDLKPELNSLSSVLNLTVRVESICTRPYSLYSEMLREGCHARCAYIAHLIPTGDNQNSGMRNSYNVTVQISRASFPPTEQCPANGIEGGNGRYFISHMIRTSKVRAPELTDLGDFVRFKLTKINSLKSKKLNKNKIHSNMQHQVVKQTAQAVWYQRLSQVGLDTKIIYTSSTDDNNDRFVLSATRYDHTTRTEKSYSFDWAKWGVYLIPVGAVWSSDVNYCVDKPKCNKLYAEYHASVKANSVTVSPETNYNVMCGDLDMHGLKTLYAPCMRKYF